ncbi:MAG: 50S ribosomal protein L23 [Proteobacteria bacterium]|jgi:large subunit ribosomal protein L23|nr:50S ribosomal protein L23 [Pseudomonadota bacterium]
MEPTTVIKMPIVTEKVTAASEHNQYAFKVDNRATKTDVKQAIEAIYGVKVVDVKTQVRRERDRTYKYGKIPGKTWKRAMVRVAAGQKIELF